MVQYFTEDKVPELLRSGGREAAAGIASAGASIGQGLAIGFEHRREDKKRKEDEDKREAQLTKHARGILDVLDPENKHTNSQLSGDEARGRAAGLYQRNLMDRYAEEIATSKRQAEAAKDLRGFTDIFAHRLQGGVSTLPNERQSDYYENPELYPEGPPKPTVSEALGAGLEAYPGATVSKDFDTSFGSILKAFPGAGKSWDDVKPRALVTPSGKRIYYGHSGQFQFEPEPGGQTKMSFGDAQIHYKKALEEMGYDILPAPDGSFTYRAKKGVKPKMNVRPFDANGDGKLTGDEVRQAMAVWALQSTGMPYEGMDVNEGGATAAPTDTKDPLGLFK